MSQLQFQIGMAMLLDSELNLCKVVYQMSVDCSLRKKKEYLSLLFSPGTCYFLCYEALSKNVEQ